MASKEIETKYAQILKQLETYNYHYYERDKPIVDDATYDALLQELTKLEETYPEIIAENSPTRQIGGRRSEKFSPVTHEPPMLSLSNVFNREDLLKFKERCEKAVAAPVTTFSAELKFDGLAVEVVYKNGRLVQGSTRGNGEVGEDITENIATLEGIPLQLSVENPPEYISLRGEVFMTHDEFARVNQEREIQEESTFANPRNAAAGSLRQLDAAITKSRQLSIRFYGIGKIIGGVALASQQDLIIYLKKLSLPVSEHIIFGNITELENYYTYWIKNRSDLPYDIDGIVIKVNDFDVRKHIGYTTKFPKWATAWKFPAKEAITQLVDVEYSLGRTGIVTPVAHLKPINIGGVLVQRATLHNFKEVERLDVHINDYVTIKRAGDVIPKIIKVSPEKRDNSSRNIRIPDRCPSCNTSLVQEDVYLRCTNYQCPGKIQEYLKFFISKDGMDMEYFGPELINRLQDSGKVTTIADIFTLKKEDLLELERMGDVLADKIIASINAKRQIPLWQLLRSLGIRNIGEYIAKVIARAVGTIERLHTITRDELLAIHEIGPGAADALIEYFHNSENKKNIDDLLQAGLTIIEENNATGAKETSITGKTFVFTGSLHELSRKEAEAMVEVHGGRATSSVSKNTDFLVVGDNPGSKFKKAEKLDVKILTEQEFIAMIKEIQ